jgi:hypothetical protein
LGKLVKPDLLNLLYQIFVLELFLEALYKALNGGRAGVLDTGDLVCPRLTGVLGNL